MLVSFSGVLSTYTYHCPHAHRLRNIQKIRIEPKESEDQEPSKRQRGIELHESLGQYMKREISEFPFVTDTIEFYRTYPNVVVEEPFWFDDTLSPLEGKPENTEHFVYIRPDAFLYRDGILFLVDWKFANPEYGAAKYYDETEFFASCLASKFPDLSSVEIEVHFPEQDYTLPKRVHSYSKIMEIQQGYINRVQRILNDKICKPIPSKARCRFCDYREEICEYSV